MTMYALFSICIGMCGNSAPQGLLLFTALEDCNAAMIEEHRYQDEATYLWPGPKGTTKNGTKAEMEKDLGYREESRCGTIYFSDYAQTERLLFGKVTCSYRTTMPESVMARSLSPYPPGKCNASVKPK
jgi:hypothetical protein